MVRVEAAPINPSDLGLLFGAADTIRRRRPGTRDNPDVHGDHSGKDHAGVWRAASVSRCPSATKARAWSIKAGLIEGSAGTAGKTVAMLGGAMYSQYRTLKAAQCLVLARGDDAR